MDEWSLLYEAHMPPISFRLLQARALERSWEARLQLLYICRGEITLWVQGQLMQAERNQVIAIHPMEIYRVVRGEAVVALYQIDLSALPLPKEGMPRLPVRLTDTQDNEADHRLRALLAEIIRASTPHAPITAALIWHSNACRLLSHLVDCYALPETFAQAEPKRDGILAAIRYARAHYQETIPLRRIAEVANYSVPYFSKLFSSFMQCSFTEYLAELRLQRARQLLTQTKLSMVEIAARCGFSDARAMSRAWRKAYACLPRDARANAQRDRAEESPGNLHALGMLMDALSGDEARALRVEHRILPTVAADAGATLLRHAWQQSIGTGRASTLLHANTQRMLSSLQSQTPFRRAILHGLLDDEMQVCSQDASGKLNFSFSNIDIVLDFLLSIRLEPLMQLGFMPKALARRADNTIYGGKSIISLPRDLDAWCRLVRALILHLFERYGRTVVEGWEFCLWSKPNNPILPFGKMEQEAYFTFYRRTYETVKECSPSIVFGSPAFLEDHQSHWLERFYALCRRHRCIPDRFRFDCYPINLHNSVEPNISERDWVRYDPDPNALRKALERIRAYGETLGQNAELPELEEWNLSVSQRELLNDTSFKAVYIVKNALETWELCSDMAYWAFYDNLGEASLSDRLFHGGMGLFARGQIRKASCYAMWMLGKLGDSVLAQGEGYIVTKSRDGYQALLYNYTHFSSLYADGEAFDMSFTNRYTPFVSQHRLHFELRLTGLPALSWQIASHTVNRRHGSAFDQWVKMGAPLLITREDTEYLQGVSQPLIKKWTETAADGSIALNVEMEPFEVRLILLTEALMA